MAATIIHDNYRNAQMGTPGGTTTTTDFDADDVRVALLDQTDSGTITAATQNFGQVNTAVIVAESAALASKTVGTVSVGTFDAADVTLSAVSGDSADYLVLRKYDATAGNSPLIVTWDSATTGLPVAPNGGDITVTWNVAGITRI